ncbi:hypothetical protein ABE137_16370 [Brevibacillus laterosporus]
MKKWGFLVIIIVLLLGYTTIIQDTDYTKRIRQRTVRYGAFERSLS